MIFLTSFDKNPIRPELFSDPNNFPHKDFQLSSFSRLILKHFIKLRMLFRQSTNKVWLTFYESELETKDDAIVSGGIRSSSFCIEVIKCLMKIYLC